MLFLFQLKFQESDTMKGMISSEGNLEVPCYPLYSLLLALNISKVDFFSLDVEGFEYQVLQSIPFDKVDISVLAVELKHGNYSSNEVKQMMKERRYRADKDMAVDDSVRHFWVNDTIFVKENLQL